MLSFCFFFLGNPNLEWQCDGCTVLVENNSIIVENRFSEPNDFEISTEIDILQSQNIRLTVEFIDYIADLVQVEVAKIQSFKRLLSGRQFIGLIFQNISDLKYLV